MRHRMPKKDFGIIDFLCQWNALSDVDGALVNNGMDEYKVHFKYFINHFVGMKELLRRAFNHI